MDLFFIFLTEFSHFLLYLFVTTGLLPLIMGSYAVYIGVKRYDKIETFLISKFPNLYKHVDNLAIFALIGLPVIIYTSVKAIQTIVHFVDPSINF